MTDAICPKCGTILGKKGSGRGTNPTTYYCPKCDVTIESPNEWEVYFEETLKDLKEEPFNPSFRKRKKKDES